MNKIIIILPILALAACGGNQSSSTSATTVSDGWGSADVTLVTLRDGTRCATLVGAYKGGITCDWGSTAQDKRSAK